MLDRPPWEEPGAVRRDLTPHRGQSLLLLARLSVVCGGLSLLLGLLTGSVAIGLGVTVRAAAAVDLEKMRRGELDPRGAAEAEKARELAAAGIVLGPLAAVLNAVALVWIFPVR